MSGGNGPVMEVNAYYPFGMMIPGLSLSAWPDKKNYYKWNAKEIQEELGLNWYDHGERMYDPEVCRWWVPDPLAEKTYHISPYAYCLNNPTNMIDPDGRFAWFIPVAIIVGKAILGGAVDAGVQVGVQMANGKTLGEAASNIDYSSVVASGVVSGVTMPGTSTTIKGVTTTITGVKSGIQTGVKAAAVALDAAADVKIDDGKINVQHVFGSGDNNKPIGDFITDAVTGGAGVAGSNQVKNIKQSTPASLLKNEFIEAGKGGLQEGTVGSSGAAGVGVKEKLESDRQKIEEELNRQKR